MKQFVLILILLAGLSAHSQDTISLNKRYKGGETALLIKDLDTFYQSRYASGELESIRPYTLSNKTTLYKRYYKNGISLWDREMKNGMANGVTIFYNEKGKKVASLVFKNDTLIDTNFISRTSQFVYGKATYYSVVHGGMQHADGSSNISGGGGNYMFTTMYSVKIDSTKAEQSVYKEFETDWNGFFFSTLEKGQFGFFPFFQDVKKISLEKEMQLSDSSAGIRTRWVGGPIEVHDQNLHTLNLHYSSVGYAP